MSPLQTDDAKVMGSRQVWIYEIPTQLNQERHDLCQVCWHFPHTSNITFFPVIFLRRTVDEHHGDVVENVIVRVVTHLLLLSTSRLQIETYHNRCNSR